MKPVPAQTVPLSPLARHRVGAGGGWQVGVEDGVQTYDVRHVGQQSAGRVQGGEGRRHVQRGEPCRTVELGAYVVVDDGRAQQVRSAVNEAVPGRPDRGRVAQEVLDRVGGLRARWLGEVPRGSFAAVGAQNRQVQAGRASVDDEDVRAVHSCHFRFVVSAGSVRRIASRSRSRWCGRRRPGRR